jgi:hypothetical protein
MWLDAMSLKSKHSFTKLLKRSARMRRSAAQFPHDPSVLGSDDSDSDHYPRPSSDNVNVFGNGLPILKGCDYHVVIDKSSVHRIRILPCACPDAPKDNEKYVHYLQMGLFPASLQDIKTVFTFAVLDDFWMDNLECKTAALNYWHKIVRLTSNEFPKSVPVSVLPFCARKILTLIEPIPGTSENFSVVEKYQISQVEWLWPQRSQRTRPRKLSPILCGLSSAWDKPAR